MSSDRRYMNPSYSCIGTGSVTRIRDVIGTTYSRDSQVVASNSENDTEANHFITGVQKAFNAEIRTYDVSGAASLLNSVGSLLGGYKGRIYAAADSTATGSILVYTTTCASTFIQSIQLPSEHDTESIATIALIFKSNGVAPPLRASGY